MGIHHKFVGSGGGGGKRDKNKGGESKNTLRSKARARVVDLIGEGPLEAVLVDGDKSIYFDETPVRDDGTSYLNFEGVVFDTRSGLPDQTHLNGTTQVETPVTVDVRVKQSTSPPVRTITDVNADAVRVIIRLPSLVKSNKDTGALTATSVSYAIDLRSSGEEWTTKQTVNITNQKTTSVYQRAHRIELTGEAPWDLRVRRITADAELVELQNETWWESYFVIVEGKFIYPNTAMVAIEVDAEHFGSAMPQRRYHVKGLQIAVPTNYDPITRIYSGIWNGTFKTAWTNNPAWVLYDLLVNRRYGCGENIDLNSIDKWGLYQIAQYCDQLVPSGYLDEEGEPIMEPRYSFNGAITNRQEAFKVLREIATAFRGMAYWSLNQVVATADMPSDPVKLVTPANTVGGEIHYSGSGLRARHSVYLVSWNDPNDFDRPAIEVVVDDEAVRQFGWREASLQTVGCRSRGQAARYGRWALYTERYETEVATYDTGFDHADVRPGQIVAIADPSKAEVRHGGRIAAVDGLELTLDAPFTPGDGETYSIMVQLPDGSLGTREITFVSDGGDKVVLLASAFDVDPEPHAMWMITGTDITPRTFRVLNVSEPEPHQFRITALQHYPDKYALIEQGYQLPPLPYTRPKNRILPPTDLTAEQSLYLLDGTARSRLTLSWTSDNDFLATTYLVSVLTPEPAMIDLGAVDGLSVDLDDVVPGTYTFYVKTVSVSGLISAAAEQSFTAGGWASVEAPYVSHLEIFDAGDATVFGGRDCRVIWRNNFPGTSYDWGTEPAGAGSGAVSPFYRDNIVRVFDPETGDLLRTDIILGETYTYTYEHNVEDNERLGRAPVRRVRYEVTVRDQLGRESVALPLTINNPVPQIIIPVVTAGLDAVFVNYTIPADLDFAGALVWMSTEPDFDPLETEPAYNGPSNTITLPATPFETVYIRLAGYDAFGTLDLNISPAFEATPGNASIDATAPEIPTNLVTDAFIEHALDGGLQSILTAQWDESPSANFGQFEVEIREEGGEFISFATALPSYEWRGLPFNTTFEIRVRAVSRNGFPSGYTELEEQLIPVNEVAPDVPTGLAAAASLRSVFLAWVNPVNPDLAAIEIWCSLTNDLADAELLGTSRSSAFTHAGVTTGVELFYWIRAINTSGLLSDFNAGDTAGVAVTPGQVEEGDIAANAITADKILAGEITGDHISVSADLAPTITVNGTGISLGDITDPADLINALSTTIQPGKITISGATTLADWRNGGDTTKIEGGAIAANTISANQVTVGLRGIDITGLQFQAIEAENKITWTAGTISYTDESGATATASITAGDATWTAGTLFIWWEKNATTISTGTTRPVGGDDVVMATYLGGVDLIVTYGRTIIDGAHIVADTITASVIKAGAIQTEHILVGNVLTDNLGLQAVTQIAAAEASSGSGEVASITITRTANTNAIVMAVVILNTFTGSGAGSTYSTALDIQRNNTGPYLYDKNHLSPCVSWDSGIPASMRFAGSWTPAVVDDDNIAGSTKYSLHCSRSVSHAFIMVLEVKR